nr:MAG TPA: hypothetical protein [Caudoviricetes sp.]
MPSTSTRCFFWTTTTSGWRQNKLRRKSKWPATSSTVC